MKIKTLFFVFLSILLSTSCILIILEIILRNLINFDMNYYSSPKKIDNKSLTISTPEGELVIENDFVLAMTGYQPDFSFLKRIGIEIGEDEYTTPFHNPDTMETNVDGVYLAGVICGGLKTNKWFIENSRDHSKIIIKEIKKNNS